MTRSTDAICANCAFWFRVGSNALGECRRYPPLVYTDYAEPSYRSPGGTSAETAWPLTVTVDWCGEWKLKAAEPETSA